MELPGIGIVDFLLEGPDRPPACPEALQAVKAADWVVLGPGSWFTSVITHLLVPELRAALLAARAQDGLESRRAIGCQLDLEALELELVLSMLDAARAKDDG